ncbi:MAG: choice-of-anchor Q domain-containing protein [Geitlerinemataceae cyanobacterium]
MLLFKHLPHPTLSPSYFPLFPNNSNGGSTDTHALLPRSPAIDRPQGDVADIGAFELETSLNEGTLFGTQRLFSLIPIPVFYSRIWFKRS